MARYRFSRTLPTGWRVRLDYIPWDGSLSDAATEIDEVALLELGDQVCEFDELPYGMIQPQTLKIRLAFTRLPSALQAYLRTGKETTSPAPAILKRNVFVLYSDRGTGGVTWTTEFVGCENDTDGFVLQPGAGDVYEYEIEAVDVVYHAMKTLTGAECFNQGELYPGQLKMPSTPIRQYHKMWNMLMLNTTGQNVYQEREGVLHMSVSDVLTWMSNGLLYHLTTYYMHGTTTLLGNVISNLTNIFTTSLELRSCNTDQPPRLPNASPVLTGSTAYFTTHAGITRNYAINDAFGGILGRQDKYSWGRSDVTIYDVLRDLCETLAVKMSYTMDVDSSFLGPFFTLTFRPRRVASPIAGDSSTTGYDAQVGALQMITKPKIGRGENNIGKAEVRWESEYSEDVKEISRLDKGTDGSRSLNVEPIIHNIPTWLPEADDEDGRYGPFLQSNGIYFKVGTALHLAHENTRYYYSPGSPGNYVQVTTTAGEQPIVHDDKEAEYRIQVNAIQAQATMAYGLTQLLLHLFANPNNATIEATWSALKTPVVLPNFVSAVYDLSTNLGGSGGTADFADVLPNLPWTKAILTSSSHNWMTGEVDTKFFLMAATGNVG